MCHCIFFRINPRVSKYHAFSHHRATKGTLFRCASFVLLKVNLRVVWSIFGSIALAHFYYQVIRTEVSACLWIAFPYVTIIFNEAIWITMVLVEILFFLKLPSLVWIYTWCVYFMSRRGLKKSSGAQSLWRNLVVSSSPVMGKSRGIRLVFV